MIKSIAISRIIARYSIGMALRAAEKEIRAYAKAGKIPVIAGVAAGGILSWLLSGNIVGAIIGGAAGAIIIHAYKKK